jgi:hypothetical protein
MIYMDDHLQVLNYQTSVSSNPLSMTYKPPDIKKFINYLNFIVKRFMLMKRIKQT